MPQGYVAKKIAADSAKSLLPSIAKRRLEMLRAQSTSISTENVSLLDYVPLVSGESDNLERPDHLEPYANLLSRAIGGNLRSVVAAPPQHGKTELTKHAFAWWAKNGSKRHAYVTYSIERAEYVSRKFFELAQRAGLEPKGRLSDVQLKGGTEIRFTSIGGSLTGFSVDGVLLVDDPVKDRASAESPTVRRRAIEWLVDVGRSRRHEGTSIIVMATRWHPEDPSGQLIKLGYEYINLKAIAEPSSQSDVGPDGRILSDPLHRMPGEALWPARKPAGFFKEEMTNAYSWASLYQGEPKPRGSSVFRDVQYYDELPDTYSVGIGIDLAYTSKTHSDYCAAVAIAESDGKYYVLDVRREQSDPPKFAAVLRQLKAAYPGARMLWYTSTTEIGLADLLRQESGVPVDGKIAKADKFVRAQPVAAAWNSGKVFVPRDADWVPDFVSEVMDFTGVSDRHDDQVDALAAAFDELADDWIGIGVVHRA